LKSQVITNRDDLDVHIVAGVYGAKHDFQLFRDNLAAIEELVASYPGEPSHILAEKGYAGDVGSRMVVLVISHKARPGLPLVPRERRENAVLSRNRVIVENFFGRLHGKFAIMAHRWTFGERGYPAVFTFCYSLVNFDLRTQGGSPLQSRDGTFFRKLLTVLSERPEEEEA
jgi:hypothetical protein